MIDLFATSVYAATGDAPGSFAGLVARIVGYVDTITAILIGGAFIVFIWGIIQLLASNGDTDGLDKGKQRMLSGIIGMFVVVAVWGLVKLVSSVFGFDVTI